METWALPQTLDLFPIGNCAASALIDPMGRFVWACTPRVDGDPFFCGLLGGRDAEGEGALGVWSIEVEGAVETRQEYLRNTPILRTEIRNADGAGVEILDFCPRFRQRGRQYRPLAFVRRVRPLDGSPRIRIRLRPMRNYGERLCEQTAGSNHIRYLGSRTNLRLTTDAPVGHILDERPFRLEDTLGFFLGADEGLDAEGGGRKKDRGRSRRNRQPMLGPNVLVPLPKTVAAMMCRSPPDGNATRRSNGWFPDSVRNLEDETFQCDHGLVNATQDKGLRGCRAHCLERLQSHACT